MKLPYLSKPEGILQEPDKPTTLPAPPSPNPVFVLFCFFNFMYISVLPCEVSGPMKLELQTVLSGHLGAGI